MATTKILTVIGTRPEAIKMAPLVQAIDDHPDLRSVLCVSAQHRYLLDQVLDLFRLTPDHDLELMRVSHTLHDLISNILVHLKAVLSAERPDLVLIHGDTATTLASAITAYYAKIPVGHVEAGLRTGNLSSPWPEEGNRRLIASIASHHFAPTKGARANLLAENITPECVHVTGNTVVDALLHIKETINSDEALQSALEEEFPFMRRKGRKLLLVTMHRRESFGSGFERICNALIRIADLFPDVDIVHPVHLNPNVRGPVLHFLSGVSNIYLVSPQSYLQFVFLMMRSTLILTDSGGIQEEAPTLNKPVLVMREATERPEAVAAGAARVVGTDSTVIVSEVSRLLTEDRCFRAMSNALNPFGDGKAVDRIIAILARNPLCASESYPG